MTASARPRDCSTVGRFAGIGRFVHLFVHAAALAFICALAWSGSVAAQEAPPVPGQPPPEVRQLLDLLQQPAVREWIQALPAQATAAPAAVPQTDESAADFLSGRLVAIRAHFEGLARTLPTLPDQFAHAWRLLDAEVEDRGFFVALLMLIALLGVGFGAEWLYRRATSGIAAWIAGLQPQIVAERLRAMTASLALGLGAVLVFAAASIGVFLAFAWPPLLGSTVVGYLVAFLILRVAWVLGRFLLAPGGLQPGNVAPLRVIPTGDESARFWYWRLCVFVGWFAFGYITVTLLDRYGWSMAARQLLAYALGLGLVAIAIECVWRQPRSAPAEAALGRTGRARRVPQILASVYIVLVWMLWVASANRMFWLVVVLVGLPLLLRLIRRSVNHAMRPSGVTEPGMEAPSLSAVCVERGLRAALIVGVALLLAQKWGIDLVAIGEGSSVWARLVGGALSAIAIILVADFLWHTAKSLIGGKIAEVQAVGHADNDESRRRARLRTLLPILQNIVLVVLIVMTILLALSALGVQIAPLIAGAGVVGVAIGFGAQTVVKDVISGMFYLLDDAFRVGEYIQSGSYKGTVESFSLRSVKLRHHRGPLYTVPFGELGAVQNMSRDWVIDKVTVGVTYDTDLDKAKKLIKQIGKELAADPEFAPHIIETLKMQGVEQFGDYAIQLRMKMMTKPGEQFVIRRRAYAMIKKAFDANDIRFAFPTVQVAGGEDEAGAAARQALAAKAAEPSAA
jgi:small-conductance mechanosensitive channel